MKQMEYNIISSDECKAPYQHNYFGCKWRLGNKASPYYWTLYTKQMLPEPSGVMPIQAAGESGHVYIISVTKEHFVHNVMLTNIHTAFLHTHPFNF